MKVFRNITLFVLAVMYGTTAFSQKTNSKSLKKSTRMEQTTTKNTIRFLYDTILNTQQFEKLDQVISPEYKNQAGDKGVSGFQKSVAGLANSFTNAHWSMEEIISEGNKVVVKQTFTGTQTGQFQNIPPTNKPVTVNGIATYELNNGKIISSQIQTDRLGFLQQLGIVSQDLTPADENTVYFTDKFFVPKTSIDAFTKQMQYNRKFIADLPGYIRGEAFQKADSAGNLTIITIAVWENQDKLTEAREAVQAEFKRISFHPMEFYQRLNIKIERELYKRLEE